MQNVESLSFEAIPSIFCAGGLENLDYAVISESQSQDVTFSYVRGLAYAFSNASFIMRQHVNAMGRLGTSAQALLQAGGMVGLTEADGIYGANAVVQLVNGGIVTYWKSNANQNQGNPPGSDDDNFYTITSSVDVDDKIPVESRTWDSASPHEGSGFFDVS